MQMLWMNSESHLHQDLPCVNLLITLHELYAVSLAFVYIFVNICGIHDIHYYYPPLRSSLILFILFRHGENPPSSQNIVIVQWLG